MWKAVPGEVGILYTKRGFLPPSVLSPREAAERIPATEKTTFVFLLHAFGRWHNHLNPDVVKGGWTEEEDKIILRMQAELGNQWAKITKMLPGR